MCRFYRTECTIASVCGCDTLMTKQTAANKLRFLGPNMTAECKHGKLFFHNVLL